MTKVTRSYITTERLSAQIKTSLSDSTITGWLTLISGSETICIPVEGLVVSELERFLKGK